MRDHRLAGGEFLLVRFFLLVERLGRSGSWWGAVSVRGVAVTWWGMVIRYRYTVRILNVHVIVRLTRLHWSVGVGHDAVFA
jgi:hypothetical protein